MKYSIGEDVYSYRQLKYQIYLAAEAREEARGY